MQSICARLPLAAIGMEELMMQAIPRAIMRFLNISCAAFGGRVARTTEAQQSQPARNADSKSPSRRNQ